MKMRFEFQSRDLWIGVHWKRLHGFRWGVRHKDLGEVLLRRTDVWLCLVPTLPLHVSWESPVKVDRPRGRILGRRRIAPEEAAV